MFNIPAMIDFIWDTVALVGSIGALIFVSGVVYGMANAICGWFRS